MEPNILRTPSVLDVLKTLTTVFVRLPLAAVYRTTRWLFSPMHDRRPLREVLGRPLLIWLAPKIPVSVIQFLGSGLSKGSDLLRSKRYAPQRSHVFERVQEMKFAGYWVCRGLDEEPVDPQDADILLFYLHGGAYILGWPALDAPPILLMAEIAAQKGLTVACFALEYSHAPGANLPEIVLQARHAYEWLIGEQDISPSKISIMGESAGGHLAIALLIDIRLRPCTSLWDGYLPQEGQYLPRPRSAFLISPWIDLFNSNPRIINKMNDFDEAFKNWLGMCAGMVLRNTPNHYRALVENFAVAENGKGSWKDILPRTTWVSGGSEERIFIEDIRDFVALARKDGTKIVLEVQAGGEHAWQNAEARPARKTFLASEANVDDESLMQGYRALARALVRAYQKAYCVETIEQTTIQ